uniref:Uncharacterized protein n=1 Tax=Glossina brevipalpis TaxID=37001 RepID=A0A1A9W4F4_9MUSC
MNAINVCIHRFVVLLTRTKLRIQTIVKFNGDGFGKHTVKVVWFVGTATLISNCGHKILAIVILLFINAGDMETPTLVTLTTNAEKLHNPLLHYIDSREIFSSKLSEASPRKS